MPPKKKVEKEYADIIFKDDEEPGEVAQIRKQKKDDFRNAVDDAVETLFQQHGDIEVCRIIGGSGGNC